MERSGEIWKRLSTSVRVSGFVQHSGGPEFCWNPLVEKTGLSGREPCLQSVYRRFELAPKNYTGDVTFREDRLFGYRDLSARIATGARAEGECHGWPSAVANTVKQERKSQRVCSSSRVLGDCDLATSCVGEDSKAKNEDAVVKLNFFPHIEVIQQGQYGYTHQSGNANARRMAETYQIRQG
jgi:hypothetical protein